MRAGAYTIHQSLTAEAAAVLKLAHGLARRRGHAQVTPLHVAFALLTQSSSSYGLLKRACLRSHPGGAAAHPLQCRALELCFNVALNRLPTSMPSSSFASSLIQPSPTLSNALVAALKRAQANQRRGCVDLHHPPAPTTSTQQQQQQPLLAIKVELDQLVISILDDPSVSRVMREAGFSSATVKSNLEDHSSTSSPPPHQSATIPPHHFTNGFLDADVRAVLDVMTRKQRGNPVVVGDSASVAEAVAGELLRRLERGDVPEDLAGAHLLRLHHLSYVHVRLMTRPDVEARVADLRRGVDAVQLHQRGGLVVYVGDLRWAIRDDDQGGSYSPVEHMVAELGRLVDDIRASRGGRARIVATASYQTYMRWRQRRRHGTAWALQAVLVPTGGGTGLALSNLHHHPSASAAAGVQPAMSTMQQSPLAMAPPHHAQQQPEEKLVLCAECSKNYEREASLVKAEAADAEGPRASLPAWLVSGRTPPPAADQAQHKDKYLVELKRKWRRLCRKLHLCVDPPCSSGPFPWWAGPCMPPTMAGLLGLEGRMPAHNGKSSSRMTREWSTPPAARWGLTPLREPEQDVVGTDLALGSNLRPLSDTASSDGGRAAPPASGGDGSATREMERRNIPWQLDAAIAEAVAAGERGDVETRWMYVKGGDHAAVRRAAAAVAETGDRVVVCADASEFGCAEELCADVVSRASDVGGGRKLVLVVGDVERAAADVVDCLVAASRSGSLKDRSSGKEELDLTGCVVILTTAKLTGGDVISLRLWSEQDDAACGGADRKRKPDAEPSPTAERSKRPRLAGGLDLNVDLCVAVADDDDSNEEEEEAIPSDITHEEGSSDVDDDERDHHPRSILEQSVAVVVTLDAADERSSIRDHLRARLVRALNGGEQHQQPRAAARVEDEAVEALAAASGQFLEETMERWVAEVLEPAAATVSGTGGGKGNVLVLGVGGAAHTATGFMGSVLPCRVHVD